MWCFGSAQYWESCKLSAQTIYYKLYFTNYNLCHSIIIIILAPIQIITQFIHLELDLQCTYREKATRFQYKYQGSELISACTILYKSYSPHCAQSQNASPIQFLLVLNIKLKRQHRERVLCALEILANIINDWNRKLLFEANTNTVEHSRTNSKNWTCNISLRSNYSAETQKLV